MFVGRVARGLVGPGGEAPPLFFRGQLSALP